MERVIDVNQGMKVIEFGKGKGVIKKDIIKNGVKKEDIYYIEYQKDFVENMKKKLKEVKIIEGDVLDIEKELGERKGKKLDCII